jgi:hypothetical protein
MVRKVGNIPDNVKALLAIVGAIALIGSVMFLLGLLNFVLKQNLFSIREFFGLY